MKWLPTRIRLGLLLLAVATGCSDRGTGTVVGTVTVDGAPLGGFEVTYCSDEDGSISIGYAKADGSYELFRGRGHTAIPTGTYKVTVVPSPDVYNVPMPNIKLPRTYTDFDESVLAVTVKEGKNVINLDLETR